MIKGFHLRSSQISVPKWVLVGTCLLLVSSVALSQHRGGRGAGGGRTAPGTPADTESPEAKQLERAAVIQARPEQVTQFQSMTRSDQAARSSAKELLQNAATAAQIDLFHYTKSITDAVDEAQSENIQFLESFSVAQKKELKKLTKKLAKTSSDMAKENKAMNRELERSKVSGTRLAEVVKRLDNALAEFQTQQAAIGTEMGITGTGKSM
jgi:hypothetical protein